MSRGVLALAKTWIVALRDYPHRCWEQILSRAIGAAIAKRLDLGALWPDADAAITEALESAPQFQDGSGFFHFFASDFESGTLPGDIYLTALTAGRLRILQELGYAVPEHVLSAADEALKKAQVPIFDANHPSEAWNTVVGALPGDATIDAQALERLWDDRAHTSWFARTDLARALSVRKGYAGKAAQVMDELRQAGELRANRRVISTNPALAWWPFDLALRDQCAVVDALTTLDRSPDGRQARDQFVRGLSDLYAGGAPTSDTQALSTCLIALLHVSAATAPSDAVLSVALSAGTQTATIGLAPQQNIAAWSADVPVLPPTLDLHISPADATFTSFVAQVEYDEDGRHAERAAVGYALERHYAVLRKHVWQDVATAPVREGDWVQVTLRISNRALRRYVAISDPVAGGLRPTDLALAGVSGVELQSLAAYDGPVFGTHQIDDRYARFYAEVLPPGAHEIHYYARATHAGSYAALSATAELMYGAASRARTPAARIAIAPAAEHALAADKPAVSNSAVRAQEHGTP